MVWLLALVIIALATGLLSSMMGGGLADKTAPQSLEIPSADVGAPIPILFGTRMIKAPNIVWWGDLRIIKVKVSVQGKK
jgi:hypothetical protein